MSEDFFTISSDFASMLADCLFRIRPVGRHGPGARRAGNRRGLAGPEIADFRTLNGPLSYRKTNWKRLGAKSYLFFAIGGGRPDRQNRRFPARTAPGDKDTFWPGMVWARPKEAAAPRMRVLHHQP